jgi:hypothetical protein
MMSERDETILKKTKWICYYSEKPGCCEENPCSFCAKRIKVDGVRTGPFTPEQEAEIEKWLEENRDLMDLLAKHD